jgi:hypothetical protein
MNFESLNKMCGWERQKAMFLIQTAENLGMDIDCYGEIGVNQNSGYTYLWLEDYQFCLYMPINCELTKGDIWASYSSPENGEEFEIELGKKTLTELEGWASFINDNHLDESYEDYDGEKYWDEFKN